MTSRRQRKINRDNSARGLLERLVRPTAWARSWARDAGFVDLYHLDNSREDNQTARMRQLAADGICAFCPEHLAAILHRSAHWTVTPNLFPYAGTALHLMLVPREHVTDLLDLSTPALQDFWPALGWVRDMYGLTYYGLGARNGDPRLTGGTVAHVHVHMIVGNPDADPVRFKIAGSVVGHQ